ncbi:MAG TPA: Trp biosynthesis-associated membrane protein [Pseudolysinimonas sp.]|nr:Trp biosynthesis-associated membrane protein [Pseudolysinimonas sp.]
MTPSRLRLLTLAVVVAEAGLVALAWSQPWFLLRLSGAEYPVSGQVAGGALLPLALASLCLVAALAIAGRFFRVVLGVLDALLGVCVVAVCAWALSDPVRASLPVLTDATGISSEGTLLGQIASAPATPWPFVALVSGSLILATGLAIAVTSRAWPVSGARYTRTRLETPEGDAVGDWDALSGGDDPTTDPR